MLWDVVGIVVYILSPPVLNVFDVIYSNGMNQTKQL